MAQFYFRLQRVLDIREVELDKAQHELYQVKQRKNELEERLDRAKQKLSNLFDYIRYNNLTVTENIRTRDYIKRQQKKIRDIYEEYNKQKEIVKEHQEIVIEKKQAKEKIVKIKEKKSEAFYKDLLSKEQKEIDELSLRLSNQEV
ncbi:MAG TPA: flagellar FliJ family protein [Halanaerobiales bacterium]|nr:flagellar FliJ family protein [Halanaerobiales bacterium]